MAGYKLGTTIIFSVEITMANGEYKSPSTSMKITIIAPDQSKDVDGVAMTENRAGCFSHNWDSATKALGNWTVEYEANDGGIISYGEDTFKLE